MFKPLFKMLTLKRKLTVLMYHQVLPEHDFMRPYEMTAEIFSQHLDYLSANFTLLTLTDALDQLHSGKLPSNAAVMTFDDGYENNASIALPMLKQQGLAASFYIASDFLNGGAMWNDKVLETVRRWPKGKLSLMVGDKQCEFEISDDQSRAFAGGQLLNAFKYLPLDERATAADEFGASVIDGLNYMMSDEQVKSLHDNGMEVGGHTCSHPILASLDDDKAFQQIADNKRYVENVIGREITSFAYPNGKPAMDYNRQTINLVKKAGYRYAVSTHSGVADSLTDRFQIPRFTPWRNDKMGFLSLLAKNYLVKKGAEV